jgi:hypothetical protein
MFKVGDCIKVKTKTLQDVFGEVVYQVVEIGLKCPECKGMDGVNFVILGGSGPAARAGYPVRDCPQRIRRDMEKGIIRILTPVEAAAAVKLYAVKNVPKPGGGIEIE